MHSHRSCCPLCRIKFTDGRMQDQRCACSRSRSKKLGSWEGTYDRRKRWKPHACAAVHQRPQGCPIWLCEDVGLRELEPWLADVVRHAAPKQQFDMKHPVEMPNEYIRGREWAQSAKGHERQMHEMFMETWMNHHEWYS